ncbi:3154_t:CDS:10, partial [Scutellospora calospora]
IGGNRNWDYRYTWVRDSAFTVYALMRLGMTKEAEHYMNFMEERCQDLNPDGSLNIMYSIDGDKRLVEKELNHLDGYRGSRPVRIGNGAYDHVQLDIYGELLDALYLYNKYGSPISYDMWVSIRKLVNYVCDNWMYEDMSIWEVRGRKQNFTYSKIMCWVAVDRGIRLSEKRVFPCLERNKWMQVRDTIYEEIMTKAWNPERKIFTQSYEALDSLDSSVLVMPLVFFISPTDPRFLSTIKQILLPPEKGGLLANNLVFRYNINTTDDGLNGEEGSFSMCTYWLIEALTRAGKYDRKLLEKAEFIFEQMIGYGNHLGLYSEEIANGGELLGNFPQAFTHISFISAAFNLDRVLNEHKKPKTIEGRYVQLVMGPAGSGKSTYCATMMTHCQNIGRSVHLFNLDPAAEKFEYDPSIDIRDLITLEDVMEELQYGPNGGLIYCLEFLLNNMDWLEDELGEYEDDYLIIDCPGQIELYTHFPIMRRICECLQKMHFRICGVYLLESQFMQDNSKFFAGVMSAIYFDPDPLLLADEANASMNPRFHDLNRAIVQLIDDYNMVSFLPLNIHDEDSITAVLSNVDNALQFGEDQEPKEPKDEFDI